MMAQNEILQARWMNSVGLKSFLIAQVLRVTDDEIHQTLDEEMLAAKEIEEYHRKEEMPKVLASIKEWQEEFPLEQRVAIRKEYLLERIEKVRDLFFEGCKEVAQQTSDLTYWAERRLERLEKTLYKLGMEVKILDGRVVGLSPERIALARKAPIADFIQNRQGMAKCPFHNEKTASMDIRKNFFYCYGCGAHGDVIDFVMKTRSLSFKEAVSALTSTI